MHSLHPADRCTGCAEVQGKRGKGKRGRSSFQVNELRPLFSEPISGTPGHPDAKSRRVYRAGKGEFELIETVTVRNLPDEFCGTYESKMGVTTIKNTFEDLGGSTRWILETDFTGKGIMRLLASLMGGMMRGQTLKMVRAFKNFAESNSGGKSQ